MRDEYIMDTEVTAHASCELGSEPFHLTRYIDHKLWNQPNGSLDILPG
jgi:hypothetical protein